MLQLGCDANDHGGDHLARDPGHVGVGEQNDRTRSMVTHVTAPPFIFFTPALTSSLMRSAYLRDRHTRPKVTQLHYARRCVIIDEICRVADHEFLSPELVVSVAETGRTTISAEAVREGQAEHKARLAGMTG